MKKNDGVLQFIIFYLFITLTNLIIKLLNISFYCEITIQICLNLCVSIGIIYFNRDFVLTKKKDPYLYYRQIQKYFHHLYIHLHDKEIYT